MIIPNFVHAPLIDKNGYLSTEWTNFFQQLIGQMQQNLSQEGFVLPQQPTTNINLLTGTQSIGAMIYDSTTNEFKVNINGTWRVVTVV